MAPAMRPAGDPVRAPEPAAAAPALVIGRFEELIALAAQKRDLGVKLALERDLRLVRCEDGRLEVTLEASAAKTLVNDLSRKFSLWTNRRWMVVVSAEQGQPTVKSQTEARQAELKTGVRADPLVQAVLARFPGAEIVGVREAEQSAVLPSGEPDDDIADNGVPEPPPVDDDFAYGAQERLDERPDDDDDR
jgi:DNA polymerase-3 subunit gamma/tau